MRFLNKTGIMPRILIKSISTKVSKEGQMFAGNLNCSGQCRCQCSGNQCNCVCSRCKGCK